jgi:hypothetical protein
MMPAMRTCSRWLPLAGLAWLCALAPAWAQDDDNLSEAKKHYDRGKELFKAGNPEEAIREFRAADKLRPSPILAYNIGLAYERMSRCKPAIDAFQRYLHEQADADNREDTEQKIAELRGKMQRGECAGQRLGPRAANPPPAGATQPTAPPQAPTTFVTPPPSQPPPTSPLWGRPDAGPAPTGLAVQRSAHRAGTHPYSLGLRAGIILGGLGSGSGFTDKNPGGFQFENTTGFLLRASFLFPALWLADGRSVLQGELFGSFARYGFNDGRFMTNGALFTGDAMLYAGGFGLRANIYPSERIPLAIVPGLGVGVGAQALSVNAIDNSCQFDTSLASVLLNIDIALRYELMDHHAFYFAPASLYVLFPPLQDGDTFDAFCQGTSVRPKQFFGLDSTKLNYGFDFGYMFQF